MAEQGMAGPSRAALVFIMVTVLIDVMALGMIIPVAPDLIKSFVEGDERRAAHIVGWFSTSWAIMQFIFMPLVGALSDRFGRRPILLLSIGGMALDFLLMALAPSLVWLFVGRIVSGMLAANFSTAMAYIADVTPPEKRSASFGMLGGVFGFGFAFAPAIGGYLGEIDLRLPFFAAAGLSALGFLYGLFVLPESLPKERRADFQLKKANPVGAFVFLRERPRVAGLAFVNFLTYLAHVSLPATFVLYAGHRYSWEKSEVGNVFMAVGIAGLIVQGGLVRLILKTLGEQRTLILGLFMGGLGMLGYGLAPSGAWFLAAIPIAAFWGVAGAASQGLMTKSVSPTEQGRLQGALSGLQAMSGVIGPLIFTALFAWGIQEGLNPPVPGAAFIAAGLILFANTLWALYATGLVRRAEPAAP